MFYHATLTSTDPMTPGLRSTLLFSAPKDTTYTNLCAKVRKLFQDQDLSWEIVSIKSLPDVPLQGNHGCHIIPEETHYLALDNPLPVNVPINFQPRRTMRSLYTNGVNYVYGISGSTVFLMIGVLRVERWLLPTVADANLAFDKLPLDPSYMRKGKLIHRWDHPACQGQL